MPIVSLSFPDQMIRDMDDIQKSLGFTGRSELVRAAIRLMLEDKREKDSLRGQVAAILAVTHNQEDEEPVTRIKHSFEDIIRTHLHNKITRTNCVELFLLEGDAQKIASMSNGFQKEDKMKSVKLVIV
ncbi:MAG: CopG family ribbon-helix-helix protein [Thaumarchaeota archaeon]|nr:MAG: CopG family ribbon-helix-helix protein [Nitrososphaerota archaeon]